MWRGSDSRDGMSQELREMEIGSGRWGSCLDMSLAPRSLPSA